MQERQQYMTRHRDRFIDELIDLLKIPSISADPSFHKDMEQTAERVQSSLRHAGCDVAEICETEGHPVVYGEKIIDPDLPTVLIYGHYDVQPPDPVNLWDSPPFDPVIKTTDEHPEGAIYARGASDDKGQMFMHVKALEMMVENDELPCNVKFMIEGEEEVGSAHLGDFIKNNRERLKNDVILVSDTSMISKKIPSVTVGLRGLSYVEVEVTGPNRDVHSGLYGGAVANPLNTLSQMIAELQDADGKITIPGFYDDVKDLSDEDREAIGEIPFDLEAYKESLGIKAVQGEKGYITNERNATRPTLDVNGMWGGYIGEGAKTVIPGKAYAKISMRLVPDQKWEHITELFQKHFEKIAPESVDVKVKPHHGGSYYVTPTDSLEYKAAHLAYKDVFGKPPVAQRSGGSIPIMSLFEEELDSKSILMGFGLASDVIHSPNEHFGVWNYLKGIETIPGFYKHFTELTQEKEGR